VYAAPLGQPLRLSHEILRRVHDDLIGARLLCQRCFLLGPSRPNHVRPAPFRYLNKKESDAAGGCVDEAALAALERMK
jgi:hypothetical protein